ncbi:MAG: lamin tail domain-containing protein [Verrucomicrobiales bacterium]|nr:lamin tail domain-containing protein [Verrucomicrobiales bacterium]
MLRLTPLWGLWIALACRAVGGDVVLNEFLAANTRTYLDEDRDSSDWIEVHNAGNTPVNLGGWFLTDRADQPQKWRFPSTNVPAGGFLIVFASGKDRTVAGRNLHTNFGLSTAGEYLALLSPEGEIATEYAPAFPPQSSDVSYGLRLGRQYYFRTPTPLAANSNDAFNDFVADTKFSHDRGFYAGPFEVAITTATEGATIRYTTDGTRPTLTNGRTYAGPIPVAGTTVLRAAAFKDSFQPSNTDTQTYLFLDDVLEQSPNGQPPPGWPASWGSNTRDYGMDPDIVNHPRWGPQLKEALESIPSFSIVMALPDLFDSSRGIYANPGAQGRSWERECSVELMYPDGRDGFQIDAGIRIRGGFSRSTSNPKHAFRLFFREEYGAGKLVYPLFDSYGADTFDGIDLRTFQNYSWSFQGDGRGIFVRDQWSRDAQLAMGSQAERGEFYHLYINGQYWGIFNTCERPEASYGETYFGGDKDDYDVIKVEAGPYSIFATDGNMTAWTQLYNTARTGLATDAAYERVQGNNPDGTPNPEYPNLVDVDNLIDYMLVILYGGNLDAPISNFLGNDRPNNWYGIRHQQGLSGGFKFFAHDAEHTLLNVSENRLGPYSAGNSSVNYSSPQWVWQQMWNNPEFRLRVADHVHRHCFNGGALTPEACTARFDQRTGEIESAVIAESARWGDAKRTTPFTQDDWRNTVNSVRSSFLAQRTTVVLNQLKARSLYPNTVAPSFQQHGGAFDPGFQLAIQAPRGQIYFTLDGSDPRLRGGGISPAAQPYSAPVPLTETVAVKARVLDGADWSALNEAAFTLTQTYSNLLVTEIMYHPTAEPDVDGDEFEFIELKNANPFAIDLSGVRFVNGIGYRFPGGTRLDAGGFAVLVRNESRFAARYPGVPVAGVYTGSLANGGEQLALEHAVGTPLLALTYDDVPPWPTTTDGEGFSLVPINAELNPDPNDPVNWRASSAVGGSPGRDDPALDLPGVVINEILTHTDPPQLDSIELYNPTDAPAAIGNWYLTDDRAVPRKFRLPADTTIPPGGYLVFDESDFNPEPGVAPSFTLNSHGEEVYLYSADADGELTGYSQGFAFGAAANGISFGRFTNSVGAVQYPAQRARTLGTPNAGPAVGPVVLSEIHYQPAPGGTEFVELRNLTDVDVPLYDPAHPANPWQLAGLGFAFPENAILPAQGLALVVSGDPEAFRTRFGVPLGVPVFGPFPGVLQNSGELLELQRPDEPDVDLQGGVVIPLITVDAVRYNDKAPWPVEAAGSGASLERRQPAEYGNDPANWRASFGPPSPGLDNDGNRPPIVDAGPGQSAETIVLPAVFTLQGSAQDDGLPGFPGTVSLAWSQVDGPGAVLFVQPDAAGTQVRIPGLGTYVLRLTAGDGELAASDDVTLIVTRPAEGQSIVAAGATWKYLDDGSDQGTAWRMPGFNDSGWSSGRAQLGYGDGDEVTTVGYGPNAGSKYQTTYFRHLFTQPGARSITELTVQVIRDDGAIVYLNGNEILRDGMPEGDVAYDTWASSVQGGADESTFIGRAVDPSLLREGMNLLAVEIHQANPNSSDISFDLQLDAMAFPFDQPPTVDAGQDLAAEAGVPVTLNGVFQDDGLPAPPGVTTFAWSRVSGPGEVQFANPTLWITTATFTEPGVYELRLTADDGASQISDETTVTVGGPPVPLRIESLTLVDEGGSSVRLSLAGPAGAVVEIQARASLTEGDWETLTERTLSSDSTPVEVVLPIDPNAVARFFRLLIP